MTDGQGFKREVSKFAPIPDGLYTMYAVEATFIISSQKQTPGVNFKMKIHDMDENGQPQQNAGKTYFVTKYLSEKTVGDFCDLLVAMGFKTDADNNFIMDDGSLMPDFFKMKDKEPVAFLVGRPFVSKLSSKPNEYEDKNTGEMKENTQYNIRPNWVLPTDGSTRKVIQQSKHPSLAAAFAMAGVAAGANAGASMINGAAAFGAAPAMAPGGAPNPAFGNSRGF